MVVKLDASEFLRDTPLFRKQLSKAESDIETFDTIYRKINEKCHTFYTDGQKYLESFRHMLDTFEYLKLILSDRDEEFSASKVKNFCSLLKESRQSEEACLNDTHKIITERVNAFIDIDMKKLKETKKLFEKASNDLDSAYLKNSDVSKMRPQQCEEAEKSVALCRGQFDKDGCEYIQNVNQFYKIRTDSVLGNSIYSKKIYFGVSRDKQKFCYLNLVKS